MSPQLGVFYDRPAPDKPAYVNEGDLFTVNDELCLIEAMKFFNPVSLSSFDVYNSNMKYRVVKKVALDGQSVNQGELLYVIRPEVEDGVLVNT